MRSSVIRPTFAFCGEGIPKPAWPGVLAPLALRLVDIAPPQAHYRNGVKRRANTEGAPAENERRAIGDARRKQEKTLPISAAFFSFGEARNRVFSFDKTKEKRRCREAFL